MKKIFVLLFAACSLVPYHSFAWGKTGHDIAGELAYHFLDDATKKKLNTCLGTTTVEEASTWMDEMRKDHSYDYMKPWHYVDFEKGTEYKPNHEENLVNELNKVIDELVHDKALPNDKVKTDLMIIFHLVEDMQQPLHVGYGDDKGGNTIKLSYLGKDANLHWVWDNEIIQTKSITYQRCLDVYKTMRPAEVAELRAVNIEQWIKEPRALLPNVYDFKDNTIDQAYVDKNAPIIEKQLLIAGLRLSSALELVLKDR